MRTQESQLARHASLLFALAVTLPAFGQGTVLIGSTTRNGSFEDGVMSPWSSHFTAVEDATFASHGDWFAVVQSSLILSPSALQNLTPDADYGLTFLLTFDARVGAPGYDSVSTRMSARTPEGTSLSASITPIVVPALSASIWQTYQYQLEMPGAWDSAGISFSILFQEQSAAGWGHAFCVFGQRGSATNPRAFLAGVVVFGGRAVGLGAAAFGGWDANRLRQFKTLSHPEHLGRAFRVLVQAR